VGAVLMSYPRDGRMKVGAVGLGAGTLATYAQPGDIYRFYEINSRVVEIANEYFKYLENCEGQVEHVLGDARLRMELEDPQEYDMIVLDAFSSDSIPVHLLTAEAFELYRSHLKPGGVICVHISNRHLDLKSVVVANARHVDMGYLGWYSGAHPYTVTTYAEWMILTNNETARQNVETHLRHFIADQQRLGRMDEFDPLVGHVMKLDDLPEDFRPWTDDYSNLFKLLR
jgi:spermidine synthase